MSYEALKKRYDQGWVLEIIDDLDQLIERLKEARHKKQVTSIGFHGNIVLVWERILQEFEATGQLLVDLGSDQTSCHNPFSGGYYPAQISYEQSQQVKLFFLDFFLRKVMYFNLLPLPTSIHKDCKNFQIIKFINCPPSIFCLLRQLIHIEFVKIY